MEQADTNSIGKKKFRRILIAIWWALFALSVVWVIIPKTFFVEHFYQPVYGNKYNGFFLYVIGELSVLPLLALPVIPLVRVFFHKNKYQTILAIFGLLFLFYLLSTLLGTWSNAKKDLDYIATDTPLTVTASEYSLTSYRRSRRQPAKWYATVTTDNGLELRIRVSQQDYTMLSQIPAANHIKVTYLPNLPYVVNYTVITKTLF